MLQHHLVYDVGGSVFLGGGWCQTQDTGPGS